MVLQKPESPAGVLLGFGFGLAFGGGCEGLLGVRQGGEVGVVRGAKPLHERLQFVLLLLEVQLHTAAEGTERRSQSERRNRQSFIEPHF